MTVTIETLQESLRGKELPGGRIVIEPHEAFIGDEALRATPDLDGAVHPVWFVIASLRCMGVTVQELGALAHQEQGDTLLLGSCRVEQFEVLRTGRAYVASARVGEVGSRITRDGSRLDSVEVVVRLRDSATAADVGEVVSTYLFKREAST